MTKNAYENEKITKQIALPFEKIKIDYNYYEMKAQKCICMMVGVSQFIICKKHFIREFSIPHITSNALINLDI